MTKLITFIDFVGRTYLAEFNAEDDSTLTVNNPATVNVQQTSQNSLQVQVIPIFLPEFVAKDKRKEPQIWTFTKSSLVLSNVEVTDELKNQYNRIFNPSPIITPETAAGTPIINLFDSSSKK